MSVHRYNGIERDDEGVYVFYSAYAQLEAELAAAEKWKADMLEELERIDTEYDGVIMQICPICYKDYQGDGPNHSEDCMIKDDLL